MIAILHKDNIIHMFLPDLISVDGGNVSGQDAAVKGTTADILVVSDYTYGVEVIPAVYEDDERITPEQRKPYIQKGETRYEIGDAINPANFTDTRAQLPQTKEQFDQQRISDIELVLADAYERGIL